MKLLILVAVVAAVQITGAYDVATKQKLFNSAPNYDSEVDPGYGTVVKAGVSFIGAKFDTKSNKLTTRVYEYYAWTDSRIKWNPAEYDGITRVSIPSKVLWKPDFRLLNAFVNSEVRDEVNVIVQSNGTVYWFPPTTYTSLCSPDDKTPDLYHCRLTLGVWTYDGNSLPLQLFEAGFDTRTFIKESPYLLKNIKASVERIKYECCPDPFDRLDITFCLVKNDHDDDHEDDDHHEEEKIDYSKCRWPHC
jgi:hypothetical protein